MLRTAGWDSMLGWVSRASDYQSAAPHISLLLVYGHYDTSVLEQLEPKEHCPSEKEDKQKRGRKPTLWWPCHFSAAINCYPNSYDSGHAMGHSPKAPSLNLKKPTFPESTTAMTTIFFPAFSAANGLTTLGRSLGATGVGKSQGKAR